MSRRLSRISLALVVFLASEVWALGLGDITMNSALNEPLNARIELLSATPEELDNLTIALASADTFERYGIDRPFFLRTVPDVPGRGLVVSRTPVARIHGIPRPADICAGGGRHSAGRAGADTHRPFGQRPY